MNTFTLKNNKGFTIIETLVAITILMISIAGPLTIAQKSLNAAIYAKDQVTASFLAQETMEKIKNERDNGRLNDKNLDTLYANTLSKPANGLFCFKPGPGLGNDCTMKIDGNGIYVDQNSSGTASKFKRYAEVTMSSGSVDAKVVVTVIWNTGTIINTVTLEDRLFDVTL